MGWGGGGDSSLFVFVLAWFPFRFVGWFFRGGLQTLEVIETYKSVSVEN